MNIYNLANEKNTSKSRGIWKCLYIGLKILTPSLLVIIFHFHAHAWYLSISLMVFYVLWNSLSPQHFKIPISKVNGHHLIMSLFLVFSLSLVIEITSHPLPSYLYQKNTKGVSRGLVDIFSHNGNSRNSYSKGNE